MSTAVIWFRRDLRLHDNEAVASATKNHSDCLFIFTIDPWFYSQPETGWLRVKFLFEALTALHDLLVAQGSRLVLLKGSSVEAVTNLLRVMKANKLDPELYFSHDVQVAYGRDRDNAVKSFCTANAIAVHECYSYFLLHKEGEMDSWWKRYYSYQQAPKYEVPSNINSSREMLKIIGTIPTIEPHDIASTMSLTIPKPRQQMFHGGEDSGRLALYNFLKSRVDGYHWKISRPFLAQNGATSLLGPHITFGTLSTRTIYQSATKHMHKVESVNPKLGFSIAAYLDRIRWRDSFTQRLWFHPELMWQNRFPEFDVVYNQEPLQPLQQEYFERWKAGTTGFPLLDASMRQLQQDGFINFRMRAMAATFLTINCGISWHYGAQHFMNCLVDGDIAINHWQWQMQAGITNPLSPAFRMYDPTKNFRDRDTGAQYVHFWLPETRGKNVETILQTASPMLNFAETRKINGKRVADIRKVVRARVLKKHSSEGDKAVTALRVTTNYKKYSHDRYQKIFNKADVKQPTALDDR